MLLIVGQHHGDAVTKRQVFPCNVKSLSAVARPGRADARPDFFAALVFACGLTVVDEVGRSVWHRNNVVSATAFQASIAPVPARSTIRKESLNVA